MKRWSSFVLGSLCGVALVFAAFGLMHLDRHLQKGHHAAGDGTMSETGRVHTEEVFSFTASGTIEQVAPLFGADKERAWSPGWNPTFLYPQPAADVEGMVFTVAHDHLRASWVNTEFDLINGRIQYVYVIPGAMVTVIRLQLTAQGAVTRVEVHYDRTALSAEADEHVRHMAEGDRGAGADWEKQTNAYLATRKK